MTDKEKERRFGRYVVKEHTARRLVIVGRQSSPLVVGLIWAVFIPVALLIGPWRGGTPLYITLTAALVLLVVSLLILRFVPRRQQFAVDLDAGEISLERAYLIRPLQTAQMELEAVAGFRCRRRLWRDKPGLEAVRWAVQVLGNDGQTWQVAEEEEEAAMDGMAHLIAKVSGRPLLSEE